MAKKLAVKQKQKKEQLVKWVPNSKMKQVWKTEMKLWPSPPIIRSPPLLSLPLLHALPDLVSGIYN